MNKRLGIGVLLVGGMMLVAAAVSAQGTNSGVQAVQDPNAARLAAVMSNRVAAESAIRDKWAIMTSDAGSELAWALTRLSAQKILQVQDATTPEELNAAIYGKTPSLLANPIELTVGSDSSDLVFFPVTPCRIVDTRSTAAGALVAGVVRSFDSQGPFTTQGGSATGCGLPGSDTAALMVTITAVGATAPGNLRAWPAGLAVPLASAVNYAGVSGLNLANTTVVPLTQDVMNDNEFSLRADIAGAHVVVDVVGYFWSPNQTALDTVVLKTTEAVVASGTVEIYSPACPAGTRAISGGHLAGFFGAPITLTSSRPSDGSRSSIGSGPNLFTKWLIQGTNSATAQDYTSFVVCASIPGR